MGATLALLDVPSSAGAFAPGQEQAPRALRAAGIEAALRRSGWAVDDGGGFEPWAWRPDRSRPRAQNLEKVVEVARETAARVRAAAGVADATLVLGGDCTVGIGSVAALAGRGRVGLAYLDAHADLNVPGSVTEGALDWMGVAHMLDLPEAAAELSQAWGQGPLLAPEQLALVGWDPGQATAFETEAIARHGISTFPVAELADDPRDAAVRARELLERRCERLLVHFDVDVIDFTDAPLSENTGRNEGVPYETALAAFATLVASPKLAGVTITELNPDHARAEPGLLERFAASVGEAMQPAAQR